jgi:hypothetical protein
MLKTHLCFLLTSQFRSMTIYNQRRLLERNTPLYIQLLLGIYFAQDQVKIECQSEFASSTNLLPSHRWSTNFLKLIDMESQVQTFQSFANLDEYGMLINHLGVLSHLQNDDQKAILAYLILFNIDESLLLSNNHGLEDMVIMNEIIFECFIHKTDSSFQLKDFSRCRFHQ